MNSFPRRWRAVFIIDLILKFLLLYGGAVLASLGMIIMDGIEIVIYFIIFAAAMAVLNVMFLMIAARLIASLRCRFMMQHTVLQAVVEVICAAAIFGLIMTLLFWLGHDFEGGALMGLFLSSTTLVSSLIALLFDGIVCLVFQRMGG